MFKLALPIGIDTMKNFRSPSNQSIFFEGKLSSGSSQQNTIHSGIPLQTERHEIPETSSLGLMTHGCDNDRYCSLPYAIHPIATGYVDWTREVNLSNGALLKTLPKSPGCKALSELQTPLGGGQLELVTGSSNYADLSGILQRRKLGVNKEKRAWSYDSTVLLLQCAKEMLHCELKEITKVVSTRLYKKHGGRAAEKKLKRLVQFDNWRQCDKSEVAERIDLLLKVLKADQEIVDSKLLRLARKVRPALFR